MKLTTLDEDLRIHQKLEDEPNDVGGLSAQELKEKFDQAGVTIQKYLNETHLPEEEQAVEDALRQAKTYTDKKAAALEQAGMKATVYDTKKRQQDIFEYTDEKVEALEQASMKGTVYDTKNRRKDVFDYTDEKVETLEQASMKTAVYDTKNRRKDVFDYTDGKIEALKAEKSGGLWLFSGECSNYVTADRCAAIKTFTEMTDPDGLWSEAEGAFVVPEGGRVALCWMNTRSIRYLKTNPYVRVKVNGESRFARAVGVLTNGVLNQETVLAGLNVKEGDRITIEGDVQRDEGVTSVPAIETTQVSMIISK